MGDFTAGPDAFWVVVPVAILIFVVPIGAFLSLYAIICSFLFHSWRELLPVIILNTLAFTSNGLALVVLADSTHNSDRYLLVPAVSWITAVVAVGIMTYRAVCMKNDARRATTVHSREAMSGIGEDS